MTSKTGRTGRKCKNCGRAYATGRRLGCSPNVCIYKKACIGAAWRKTKKRKIAKKSQTAGTSKVVTCQATSLERYMAKRSRSYKHRLFSSWEQRIKKWNK